MRSFDSDGVRPPGRRVIPLAERRSSARPRPRRGEPERGPPPAQDPDVRPVLEQIVAEVLARTGRDFGGYRPPTLERRLAQRMRAVGVEDTAAYLDLLRRRPGEVRGLADDLLVPVTSFFRDPDVFWQLEQVVIPRLFDRLRATDAIRVWSAGCATGEEAYSLSILLHEEAARRGVATPIRVFATDLHEPSLALARAGTYPRAIEAHVSAERLARFFQERPAGYRIEPRIRESVVFAVHDLFADPPFSHIHLVACRNLLIYLRPALQRRAVELLHYALVPGGDLVLGTSETTGTEDLFGASARGQGVYRRRDVETGGAPFSASSLPRAAARDRAAVDVSDSQRIDHGVLHERMIVRAAPASVLVNPADRIVHASAGTDRYLAHPAGRPTTSVHALLRGELLTELGALLVAARSGPGSASSRRVMVRSGVDRYAVVMHAHAATGDSPEGYVLLTFEEGEPGSSAHAIAGTAGSDAAATLADSEAEVRALRLEADRARLTIRALTETYQAGQEDLEASNCELQSANEELRSTLEELETRKDDLQRANEGLERLDAENRRRVDELHRLARDLEHFVEATDVAALFLDRELRVLRFTPAIRAIFSLQPTDQGRPLSDITHTLEHQTLGQDIAAALEGGGPVEREVRDREGRWYLLRVRPYPSAEGTIGGVAITLVDICVRKRADDLARASVEQCYRTLADSIDQAFCVIEMIDGDAGHPVDFGFVEVNPAFREHTGIADAVGRRMREIAPGHEEYWFRNFGEVARTGEAVRFEADSKALRRRFDVHAFGVGGPGSTRVAVLFQDVSCTTARNRRSPDPTNISSSSSTSGGSVP